MRLSEVRCINPVYTDDNIGLTYLHEKHGYVMSLEQGIVSIAGPKLTGGRIVPFAACSATPAKARGV